MAPYPAPDPVQMDHIQTSWHIRSPHERRRIVQIARCPLDRVTSGLGHVWTAPWQGHSDVRAALVGCGHVSGLLMRQVWPLALMLCADRVPIVRMHFKVR